MAQQKKAIILESKPLNEETKLLHLKLEEGQTLNFTGGQYVIVNTNISLPQGKLAKRAYSILSRDNDQDKFQIAVKKLLDGPASNYFHDSAPGTTIPFSGPWGQFFCDPSTKIQKAMVIATDTGITAALGLIQSQNFKNCVKKFYLLWLVESLNYFLPPSFLEEKLGADCAGFFIRIIPGVWNPERGARSLELFKLFLEDRMGELSFLSGDGNLLYPFKDELLAQGFNDSQIKIECFFNNPFKKITTQRLV